MILPYEYIINKIIIYLDIVNILTYNLSMYNYISNINNE